ncbi:hypothetical protein MRB53_036942 [Persea americana]|nr:hypothetical protein MRB53_036942 [Persea americana]
MLFRNNRIVAIQSGAGSIRRVSTRGCTCAVLSRSIIAAVNDKSLPRRSVHSGQVVTSSQVVPRPAHGPPPRRACGQGSDSWANRAITGIDNDQSTAVHRANSFMQARPRWRGAHEELLSAFSDQQHF